MQPESLKCPVCQSTNLSDEAVYAAFENTLRFRASKSGLFGPKHVGAGASSGRLCYDCGFMLLFVSEKDRKKVKER